MTEQSATGQPAEHLPERPGQRVDDMPWAGWGEPLSIPAATRSLLEGFLGATVTPPAPVAVEDVVLPPSRLSAAARSAFAEAVGAAHVEEGRPARLGRAGGKTTTGLLRRRAGDAGAPDAV